MAEIRYERNPTQKIKFSLKIDRIILTFDDRIPPQKKTKKIPPIFLIKTLKFGQKSIGDGNNYTIGDGILPPKNQNKKSHPFFWWRRLNLVKKVLVGKKNLYYWWWISATNSPRLYLKAWNNNPKSIFYLFGAVEAV